MLAVNKADLLPRLNHRDLRYLRDRLQSKGLRVLSAHAVCASSGQGVGALVDAILPMLGGRDVFVCGSVNVGKSTLVKAMSAEMAARVRFRGRHAHRRRERLEAYAVTTSHLPGTTLQAVRIPCFASFKHALWDTPGIINRHNVRNHHFPGAQNRRQPCT